MQEAAAAETLDVAIAGSVYRVHAQDADLILGFRHMLADFAASGTPDLQLKVRYLAQAGPPCALLLNPQFAEGRLTLSHPRLAASVDAKAGQAQLELAATEPWADVEYVLRICCALMSFERGGLLLHAAAMQDDKGARVFFGPSGAGKTSLTRNAAGRRVLNDDLVVLQPDPQGKWQVHATPFTNPSQVRPSGPVVVPLAGLYGLSQATEPRLQSMRRAEALAGLLACTPIVSLDPSRLPRLIERLDALLRQCPARRLYASLDSRFWQLLEAEIGAQT